VFTNKLFLIVLLIISLLGNVFLFLKPQKTISDTDYLTLREQYPFLSQRVLIPEYNNEFINNFLPLREQLHTMTDPYKDEFAYYFEYIPTGTSVGLHNDSKFTAASLLKVPVVMAYFRMKEKLGIKEDKTVTLKQADLDSKYGELYKKGVGYPINLGDAVKLTLQQSDNTASLVLAHNTPEEHFTYVYEGLDIEPALVGDEPIITAEQYVSILKALYFSSILNKENSQYILDLLTITEFSEMLPAGVPDNIPVAHKVGLIDEQIYNDCGIVYIPQRPYALCMISKSDRETARARMQAVSQAVYTYIATY
jgi:beta-lactamase class A